MSIKPDDLKRVGEALYGYGWQTHLAAAIQVDTRTMRRWIAGDSPTPEGLRADLLRLLGQRSAEVGRALAQMARGS